MAEATMAGAGVPGGDAATVEGVATPPPTAVTARAGLIAAVDVVRGQLARTSLPLEGAGVEAARRRRVDLLDQIDDYLLPRLRSEGAPLLIVVGGSTGAGKSTLVNSLLGAALTAPGVLRPTTRSPVLVHHPTDGPWFIPERILPNLTRVHSGGSEPAPSAPRSLRLVPFSRIPAGLALLDAPDIDSVETANRELASQLLAAADLWLFVTTAARYADAVPWDVLRAAAARRAQVALVIDRVDEGSEEVVEDLRRLAQEHGLGAAPLFAIAESELDTDGLLPEEAVADLARWLTDLGGSAQTRGEVAAATRDGVLDELVSAAQSVADAAAAQSDSAARLREMVGTAYDDAATAVRAVTTDGEVLRGEVLGRWQDLVGASDVMRSIERGVGKVRDSVGAFFRGGRAAAQPVEVAIAHSLEAVVLDSVETARERVRSGWRSDPAGAALLADATATAAVTGIGTADLRAAISREVRAWQQDVLALVRDQGEDRRGLARALSFGVNGLGVALMLLVFAGTGGLTGVEVGIAGGTAVLAQRILEAAFGDDAVRRLTKEAAIALTDRLEALLRADAAIALTALTASGVGAEDGPSLRRAARALAEAAEADHAARAVTVVADAVTTVSGPGLRGSELVARQPAGSDPGTRQTARSDSDVPTKQPGFWRRLFGRR